MFQRRKLTRIRIQSGCVTRKQAKIDGVFEVLIDFSDLNEMMEKASKSKGGVSQCGPLIVKYQRATKEQADFLLLEQA